MLCHVRNRVAERGGNLIGLGHSRLTTVGTLWSNGSANVLVPHTGTPTGMKTRPSSETMAATAWPTRAEMRCCEGRVWKGTATAMPGRFDLWRLPALLAWLFFLAVGLFPMWTFETVREWGFVATQRALVNSHWMLITAWAGYFALFVLSRCREAGQTTAEAQGRALQVGIIALLAFLPVRLEQAAEFAEIIQPFERRLLFATILAKGLAWVYLLALILQYYLIRGHRAFTGMACLFPSVHMEAAQHQQGAKDKQETPYQKAGGSNGPERS